MRLPPQLAIRQRSVQLYLEHELGSEAMEDIGAGIEVKEVLKYLICDAFEEASSIPFDPTVWDSRARMRMLSCACMLKLAVF